MDSEINCLSLNLGSITEPWTELCASGVLVGLSWTWVGVRGWGRELHQLGSSRHWTSAPLASDFQISKALHPLCWLSKVHVAFLFTANARVLTNISTKIGSPKSFVPFQWRQLAVEIMPGLVNHGEQTILWLPISYRIKTRILTLVFRVLK